MAAKLLKRYVSNYPKSPFTNYAKIYLADTLAKMNNFENALDMYNEIAEAGQEGPMIDSIFRKGDVYFLRQDYRRAEKVYRRALAAYPNDAKDFPNVWFNLAESQFNLAEYKEALKNYKRFFDLFPRHPYGGNALTRIGELIDILSGDRHRAQGFYNESFFRFRHTTGGVISRVRSLSQRFKGMSKKHLKETIREIRET